MKNLLVISILVLTGCSDYAEVTIERQQSTVRWEEGGMESVRVEPWHVGPLKRQVLSMGVRLKVNFPRLKESDIEALGKKHDIDSWLVTFSRASLGRKERLGSFFMPLFKASGRRGGGAVSSEAGYIDYFYAAASISTRLRALNCPALGHRLTISEAKIRDSNRLRALLVLGPMQESLYMGRPEKLDFQRNIINGGESLLGEYEVSFAFYNSKNNRILSNEVTAPQTLVISGESTKNIRGCENAQTPPLREGGDKIDNFKFGR